MIISVNLQLIWMKISGTCCRMDPTGQKCKLWCGTHILACIELKFGGSEWFEHMKILEKFQLILIIYEGTSFTDKQSKQKLRKIAVGEWTDELRWFLVSMSYLSMLTTMKNFSSNGSRVQALPLQLAQLDRNCKLMLCSRFELWNLGYWWKWWTYG